MRTTIRMNEALAREAKQLAAATGKSFTAVVEQAVGELLAKHRPSKPRRYVPLPTCGDPSKKITWEEYQRIVEQTQLEDDRRSLGLMPDDHS